MVLTLLGNNPVNVEDGWVIYNPIGLQADRTYLLEIEIFTSNPDLLFSNFVVRYAYPTQNSPSSASLFSSKFYYEPIRQNVEFNISSLLAPSGSAIFAVRRFSFYSQPPTLATATVALAVDPALFY